MENSQSVITVLSQQASNLTIPTTWDVNESGVCQVGAVEDSNFYNQLAMILDMYVSFQYVCCQHGSMLRVFSGIRLERNMIQNVSYLPINIKVKNLVLPTLLKRKEYVFQFYNTKTGYMREVHYPLDTAQIAKISRCYAGISHTNPKKQNWGLVKAEIDKQFPIAKEIETFKKIISQGLIAGMKAKLN